MPMGTKYPNDASGDVFRRMVASGFDFQLLHNIEFFAIFPTEEEADEVARQYLSDHRAGDPFVNIETRPASSGGMELIVVKTMLVTYENVTGFEAEFERRVSTHHGHLDGWGVWQG
jgi:Regulator of ribonuclease activity B